MKIILIQFLFLFFIQIQAQVTNKFLKESLTRMSKSYGKGAVINGLQLLSADLMENNTLVKRDRLFFRNANSNQVLGTAAENFLQDSENYVISKNTPPSFVGFPSIGVGGSDYKIRTDTVKIRKERFYMRRHAGTWFHPDEGPMQITEGKRILLLLNSLENVMNLSLDN